MLSCGATRKSMVTNRLFWDEFEYCGSKCLKRNLDVRLLHSVMYLPLIANVTTLNGGFDACALFNSQMRLYHFPVHACKRASRDQDLDLHFSMAKE